MFRLRLSKQGLGTLVPIHQRARQTVRLGATSSLGRQEFLAGVGKERSLRVLLLTVLVTCLSHTMNLWFLQKCRKVSDMCLMMNLDRPARGMSA